MSRAMTDRTARKLYPGPLAGNRRSDIVDVRPDDVVFVTPPKCGTTWMQTIVALLFTGKPDVEAELSVEIPWVDIRFCGSAEVVERLEAMNRRQCMKRHRPMDGLPLDHHPHYICLFRNPLDAHVRHQRLWDTISERLNQSWNPAPRSWKNAIISIALSNYGHTAETAYPRRAGLDHNRRLPKSVARNLFKRFA